MTKQEMIFPQITTEFYPFYPTNNFEFHNNNDLYTKALKNILINLLPQDFFSNTVPDIDAIQNKRKTLIELLPLLKSYVWAEKPKRMSFFVVSKFHSNSWFFFEMISHWLIPGKRLNVLSIYAADFSFAEFENTVYTACEVMIQVQSNEEFELIQRNLPLVETEVRLGMQSSFYAHRILEIKGLSNNEKTVFIQEHISQLTMRLPKHFDQDIITEMQHVLVICQDDFKAARDCRLLSRIISVHYLFRKNIREAVKQAPTVRHLNLKLIKSVIYASSSPKKVLGILIGVNFLKDKEIFEQKHLLNAIRTYVPKATAIEHSFISNRLGSEPICTLYLEVEKEGGEEFTSQEMALLRQELPSRLKDSIEYLMHPVFMPRNEEEILRNILVLSNQMKYLRDIPQVYISFDEQTHANLFFTIILVRILKPDEEYVSIQDLFLKNESELKYIPDCIKKVGFLRNKYVKEANVFRIKMGKEKFLRRDHSINLYEARQFVVLELLRIVGDFRDYNGGIISKQTELLLAVKNLLEGHLKYHDVLLENFFYSLSPVIMRTVLQPDIFKTLFIMLLKSISLNIKGGQQYHLTIQTSTSFVFVLVKTSHRLIQDALHRAISKLPILSSELANAYVQMHGIHYIGYIYRSDDNAKLQVFKQAIQNSFS